AYARTLAVCRDPLDSAIRLLRGAVLRFRGDVDCAAAARDRPVRPPAPNRGGRRFSRRRGVPCGAEWRPPGDLIAVGVCHRSGRKPASRVSTSEQQWRIPVTSEMSLFDVMYNCRAMRRIKPDP